MEIKTCFSCRWYCELVRDINGTCHASHPTPGDGDSHVFPVVEKGDFCRDHNAPWTNEDYNERPLINGGAPG